MDILIKSAKIINPASEHHLKTRDILIVNGKIKSIAANISGDEWAEIKKYSSKNLHVSTGWIDLKCNLGEPGLEHKEDLTTGLKAAAAGGFTTVLIMPSTKPPIQSKADVEFIQSKTKLNLVTVLVAGSLSVNGNQTEMAELYDMYKAGAVAFTDDKKCNHSSGFIIRALQYCKTFNAPVIVFADDDSLNNGALINESPSSVKTGIKGSPVIAEELITSRNIKLCNYAEGRMHFSTVSTPQAAQLVKQAKNKGTNITAEVAAHYLLLDESNVESFNSNYKVKPVLRSKSDISTLKKAVADGTIDAICSDHSPQDIESKEVEYDFAAHGVIGFETCYAVANTALRNSMSSEEIIEKFTTGPEKVLALTPLKIETGADANLTLFNPELEWTFTKENIYSKSNNTPFIGTTFIGKVLAVANNNKWFEV
ncbi:MAG TPA: dihydroorotase [Bacteroidia bacterium]|nr:dihydroorotase [Bacteroidia bacterium]HNU34178.1 dihydroorotase [Bacteroidia bacterium]